MEINAKKVSAGAPKWVVTFGDLMSLLLCFFILLLSFSELDRKKYKQVAGSLEKAFGVQRKIKEMEMPKGIKMISIDFDQEVIATRLKEEIGHQIEEEIETRLTDMKDQIQYEANDSEIIIRMMGESTFDSGEAVIKEELKPLLLKIGKSLEDRKEDIIISGHTDNIPLRKHGTYKSNLILSIFRAATVAEFFIENTLINPAKISTMGYGEYRPIDTNETPEGRKRNRRVEIIIGTIPDAKKGILNTSQ